jgi:two-component system chemotaxis response regulator CheY
MAAARILIVDDASLVRLYYRQALEAAGFTVDEAINGIEALERVLLNQVDMLIVDVNMPKMDGLTFIKALRRQTLPLSSIPVLIISTEAGPQDIAEARDAGANFYHVKPISQGALVQYAAMFCGLLK